jgi:hypothetical protein
MNWLPIIAVLGFVAAGLGVLWAMLRSARSDGAAAAQAENSSEVVNAIKEHQEVKRDVDGLLADDARKRLQQWARR